MPIVHQVNHPGSELKINFKASQKHESLYRFFEGNKTEGIRFWNHGTINGRPNSHKRKFIEHYGKYLTTPDGKAENPGLLRFWGEYEGHSQFELLNKDNLHPYWDHPRAVHRPFFYSQGINEQNTDPYLFGENFYFAVCKKQRLLPISPGDIVIFGSEFGPKGDVKFYLDTLFVIDQSQKPKLELYPTNYQESTLKRLGITDCSKSEISIDVGKKFTKDAGYFSFFPAKPREGNDGFGRPIIDTVSIGLQKPGARTGAKSLGPLPMEEVYLIWDKIAHSVCDQGFVLGTHLEDLETRNTLI